MLNRTRELVSTGDFQLNRLTLEVTEKILVFIYYVIGHTKLWIFQLRTNCLRRDK